MREFIMRMVVAGVGVFAGGPCLAGTVFDVGESKTFTLAPNIHGDPVIYPTQALKIDVTAGKYKFFLEDDALWFFGNVLSYGVGGIAIADENLVKLVVVPYVTGTTNANATTRTFFFDVTHDQTLLAGVVDNFLPDNSGTPTFTLTKLAAVGVPAPAAVSGGMAGFAVMLLGRRRRE